MVTVPRIAVVSCLSTTPFIYGIRHEGKLRAELLLSDPDTVTQDFLEHRADIALIPFTSVPLLADARTVTEYCVGGVASARETLLARTRVRSDNGGGSGARSAAGLRGAVGFRLHLRQRKEPGAPAVLGLRHQGRSAGESRLKRLAGTARLSHAHGFENFTESDL